MLSSDLPMSKSTRSMLEDIIEASGGRCVTSVRDADAVVCQYRDGPDFTSAALDPHIYVGNLAWLYHVAVHDRWASPQLRLTHYPQPRDGVPGFSSYLISLSGYAGAARVYLEQLATAAGGRFSRQLGTNHTHLLAAVAQGEKVEAAREWGTRCVNHLWLEDSYASNTPQSIDGLQYQPAEKAGPAGLGRPVGQTPIDMDAVRAIFLRRWRTNSSPMKTAGAATAQVAESVKVVTPPSETEATVGPLRRRTDALAAINVQTPRRRPGRPRRISATAAPPSPPLSLGSADDKENRAPAVVQSIEGRSSRKAKSNALGKLHDNAIDMLKFEKERRRAGGVTHGREKGERESESRELAARSGSPKRKYSEATEDDEEEEEEEVPSGKKARVGRPSGKIRLLVSMYDRWLNKPELIPKDKVRQVA
jgi:hypothetical protein